MMRMENNNSSSTSDARATTFSFWQEHDFDEESSGERSRLAGALSTRTPSFTSTFTVVSAIAFSLVIICTLFSSYEIITAYHYRNLLVQTINSSATTKFNTPSDHSPLLPLQPSDVLGFTLAVFGLILASGGGIGGGGMLVPIYILVMGFLPKHAIPLSNVTVFGGAIANMFVNVKKRHPGADRPLIDWELVLAMQPPCLFGVLIGANLNKVLPEKVVAVMLVILLTFTAYSTFKKAFSMYRLETVEMNEKANESNRPLLNSGIILGTSNTNGHHSGHNFEPVQLDACGQTSFYDSITNHDINKIDSEIPEIGNPVLLQSIIDQERHVNTGNVTLIIIMFIIVVAVNILKGGGSYPSPIGISCGSITFWTVQLLLLLFIGMISAVAHKRLINYAQLKMDVGYRYLKEDIHWDEKSTVVYFSLSLLAGCCAGMFGIGGGIVQGPLMLAMGVHPAVASATSACMILFTSFTATTTYAVHGILVHDYAVVCTVLGFMSTAVGQLVMSNLLKKTNRNSYIAFSIGIVILLSALLMTLQTVMNDLMYNMNEKSSGICGHM
ncbi:hypothetical protein ACHAW6_006205 [Cyclotella cf. meneghiniana]